MREGRRNAREQGSPQLRVLGGEHAGEGSTERGSPSPVIPASYGMIPGKWHCPVCGSQG